MLMLPPNKYKAVKAAKNDTGIPTEIQKAILRSKIKNKNIKIKAKPLRPFFY
jgi:hypothetical protein